VVKIDVERRPGARSTFGVETPEANSGSGVIVEVVERGRRNVGYVITNNHVVANAPRIAVTLFDGRRVEARLVGTDTLSDLAVLTIEADNLIAAEWGDSDTLRKGDWVLAFGSPFGFIGSMTSGIVSALNRTQSDGVMAPQDNAYRSFIQVDAAINPGNSGGPLVNVQGKVVGINSAIFTRTGDFSGIGFAIPSNQARRVYEDLRDRGRVVRGWLGVNVASLDLIPPAERPPILREIERGGVLVTNVFRDTPAAEAGIRRGDVITKVEGQPVDDSNGVRTQAAFAKPGQTLALEVFRDGQHQEISIVVGEMPEGVLDLADASRGMNVFQPDARTYGLRIDEPANPLEPSSAMVVAVLEGSPAWDAGIRPGDVILSIQGYEVDTAEQANQLLTELNPTIGVTVRLLGNDREFEVQLRA
jgi:serine protease Do